MTREELLEYARKMDEQKMDELGQELDSMTKEQRKALADEIFPINLTPVLPIVLDPKLIYANPRVGGTNHD